MTMVKPEHLKIEYYRANSPTLNKDPEGVRITHTPTGTYAQVAKSKVRHENRKEAEDAIKAVLKAKGYDDE